MLANCSLMGIKKGAFGLSTAELCCHKSPIIRNGFPSSSRNFLRDFAIKARPKPRKVSPRILEGQAIVPIEEYLPPVSLLRAAYKAGVLKIEPETALNIIRRYVDVWTSERVGWEKRFLEEENIGPETLTTISLILNRSTERPRRIFATRLLHTASSLGDLTATVFILTPALRSRSLHKPIYAPELSRLKVIANSPNPDLSALLLLGRIHESQSNPSAALQCFRKAASISSKSPNPAHQSIIAEALVAEGTLLLARKDHVGAQEAFRKAALEHDNPHGYFHLAASQDLLRSTRADYLLKAASSGVPDAPAQLASLYLEKAMSIGDDLTNVGSKEEPRQTVGKGMDEARKISDGEGAISAKLGVNPVKQIARAMGREWLILAASGGDTGSMRGLADILHLEGEDDVAETWERLAAKGDKSAHQSA